MYRFIAQERSKDPDAPVLFWTNGGPGCSSLFGLFMENGPYVIQEDLSLKWREYGWDVGQNMIYVDLPVGTGFSETTDDRDYARNEDTVGKDMLAFFEEFMSIHPELRGKDLYLSGESYAGAIKEQLLSFPMLQHYKVTPDGQKTILKRYGASWDTDGDFRQEDKPSRSPWFTHDISSIILWSAYICPGHYLPAIADAIAEATKAGRFMSLNLRGIILGNPWTSPMKIVTSVPDFAEANDLISKVSSELRRRTIVQSRCLILWVIVFVLQAHIQ